MVGGTPEIEAKLDNVPCKSLIDTGSQISTVSISFYNNNLAKIPIQNCQNLLRVEGVGGDILPYHGYINCENTLPLTDSTTFSKFIPILIVPRHKIQYSNTLVLLAQIYYPKFHQINIQCHL